MIVSGADAFTGSWTNYSGNIYSATAVLPLSTPSSSGLFANQVFVDSQMVNEARWPNAGQNLITNQNLAVAASGSNSSTLVNSSIPTIPGGWTGGTAYFQNSSGYIAESGTVTATSGTSLTIDTASEDTAHCPYDCLGAGSKFFLYGKLAALDSPGEWFYDSAASKLYMWAPSGGVPTGVEIKTRSYGFDLSGRSNILIRGIDLFGTSVLTSSSSASNVMDSIHATYVSHFMTVPFDSSKPYGGLYQYSHQADTGIILNGTGETIKNSTIQDSAGNGISVVGSNASVTNNLVLRADYGMLYNAGIHSEPALSGVVISRNTIRDSGRDGIGVNTNDPASQIWTGNTISYNDISNSGALNNDVGNVYLCCSLDLTSTRIDHNWVHDNVGLGAGIYLDAGSGKALVDHNVSWNNGNHGLYLNTFNGQQGTGTNYGTNQVDNNTLLDGAVTANGSSDQFTNNIFNSVTGSPSSTTNLTPTTSAQFVNTSQNDYRVLPSSPAVDAGTFITGVTTNAVGTPDIGAFEAGAADYHPGCTLAGCGNTLLNNGDFEAGSLGGWCNAGASCSGQSISAATPAAGSYSAALAGSGSELHQIVSGLTPGVTYSLTASGKVASSADSLAIGIQSFGSSAVSQTLASTSWSAVSLMFTEGSGSTSADIFASKTTGSGSAQADSFVLSVVPTPDAPINALRNSGFETGSTSGWCNTGTYCAGLTVNAAAAHSGGYGVSLAAAGSDLEQADLGLQSLTTYRLTGYAKVATAGEELWVGMKSYGGPDVYQVVTSTSWTPISVTFATGTSPTAAGKSFVYKNTGSGMGYADDLNIGPATATTNYASNGDFETGSLASWCNAGAGTYCSGDSISASTVFQGNYAAQVAGAGADLEQVVAGLSANTTYTLTAMVKSTNGEQTWVGVKTYGGADSWQVVSSDSWTPVAVTFTTGASATSAKIFLWKNTGAGNGYADNIIVSQWSLAGH